MDQATQSPITMITRNTTTRMLLILCVLQSPDRPVERSGVQVSAQLVHHGPFRDVIPDRKSAAQSLPLCVFLDNHNYKFVSVSASIS